MGGAWIGILGFAAPADGQRPNALFQFLPFILIFGLFYLLVFAPMRRKQKRHDEMVGNLKTGDRVVTSGGLHGTVVGLADGVVQLRIADQVKVDISRSAIAAIQGADE